MEPNLLKAGLLAGAAAILFTIARFGRLPDWANFLLVLFAGICGFLATLQAADWIVWKISLRTTDLMTALHTTERTITLDKFAGLNKYQTEFLNQYVPVLEIIGGAPRPLMKLDIGTAKIPYDFIEEFISRSHGQHLASVRDWSEGSHAHEYADALTTYFVNMGFAKRKAGEAAEWNNKSQALAWIGMN